MYYRNQLAFGDRSLTKAFTVWLYRKFKDHSPSLYGVVIHAWRCPSYCLAQCRCWCHRLNYKENE